VNENLPCRMCVRRRQHMWVRRPLKQDKYLSVCKKKKLEYHNFKRKITDINVYKRYLELDLDLDILCY
jgi:hypothetical protein